jgi:D-alanyl-D-alanine carboxypeptidase
MRDDPDMPIVLRGELTQGSREVWRVITVPDPPAYAASVLRHTLEAEGIRVVGAARSVPDRESSRVTGTRIVAPAFTNGSGDAGRSLRTVAVHYSPPVRDLLPVVNVQSHNLYAELLLHSMGRTVEGTGSFDEGARVLARYLSDVVGAEGERFVPRASKREVARVVLDHMLAEMREERPR